MGIPHLTLDLREEFGAEVVDDFLDGYAGGGTPNPCVRCNGLVRFDRMLALASRLGAARLVTGHYARIAPVANAFSFTDNAAGGILRAIPAEERLDQLEQGNTERCPGAATQIAEDGSNGNTDALLPPGGCDPTQYPPGP